MQGINRKSTSCFWNLEVDIGKCESDIPKSNNDGGRCRDDIENWVDDIPKLNNDTGGSADDIGSCKLKIENVLPDIGNLENDDGISEVVFRKNADDRVGYKVGW